LDEKEKERKGGEEVSYISDREKPTSIASEKGIDKVLEEEKRRGEEPFPSKGRRARGG